MSTVNFVLPARAQGEGLAPSDHAGLVGHAGCGPRGELIARRDRHLGLRIFCATSIPTPRPQVYFAMAEDGVVLGGVARVHPRTCVRW